LGERFRLLYLKSPEESSPSYGAKGDEWTAPLDTLPADALLAQAKSDLKHSDPKVRIFALQYLEGSERSTAGPLFEERVTDSDPRVRAQALSSLIKCRGPEAAPILNKCLKDSDPWVRMTALRGLFEMDQGVDPNLLIPFLKDESPLVRRKVATLLGWNRIEGGFPILTEMSRDGDPRVRKAALFSLLTFYPEESEGRIAEAVVDADPTLRRWARDTLERRIARGSRVQGR
jgi:HEAT repeat protein